LAYNVYSPVSNVSFQYTIYFNIRNTYPALGKFHLSSTKELKKAQYDTGNQ